MSPIELLEEAKKARLNSYSPYSHFAVGAALLTKSGKLYTGSNVESASYGLTLCAERNTIFHAVNDGFRRGDFALLAVVADTDGPTPPCGACRQIIAEFFDQDAKIILGNLKGDILETNVKELIPFAFTGDEL